MDADSRSPSPGPSIVQPLVALAIASFLVPPTCWTGVFPRMLPIHALASDVQMPSRRPSVLVTGSTDGIGITTAKHLASKGYNVLIHGREGGRIQDAARAVTSFCRDHHPTRNDDDDGPGLVIPLPAADISTVRGCIQLANDVKSTCDNKGLSLTVLMNNAGVYSEDLVRTSDGLEVTFAVNVLAPFVVTSMLLSTLLRQPKSRIVIASSISQSRSVRDWDDVEGGWNRPYSAHGAYSESKLLDAMLSMEMASRLQKVGLVTDRVTCNCLDPGTVNTKMLLAGWGRIGMDVDDALDETWLCSSEEVNNVTGEYFIGRSSRRAASSAYDRQNRDTLWRKLTELAPEAAMEWDRAIKGTTL